MPYKNICILLATYNGARFLPELIESLHWQTMQNFSILVRDDGSSDGTSEYLCDLAEKDARVFLHPTTGQSSGGAARNFSHLLEWAKELGADAVFPCDQDDVWEPARCMTQLDHLSSVDRSEPALSVCSRRVFKKNLFSGWSKRVIKPSVPTLSRVSTLPMAPGCTFAINRPLLELAVPVPHDVIMHDWWLTLVAAGVGRIEVLDQPLVNYRQHAGNVVGEPDLFSSAMKQLMSPKAGKKEMRQLFAQLDSLRSRVIEKHDCYYRSQYKDSILYLDSLLSLRNSASNIKATLKAAQLGVREERPIMKAVFLLRLLFGHHKSPGNFKQF